MCLLNKLFVYFNYTYMLLLYKLNFLKNSPIAVFYECDQGESYVK